MPDEPIMITVTLSASQAGGLVREVFAAIQETTMASFNELVSAINGAVAAMGAATQVVNGLADQLRAGGLNDPVIVAQIDDAVAQLQSKSAELTQAIAAAVPNA